MYALSAFITMSSMANNTPSVDSPIGELSSTAATYSREVGKYALPAYPDVKMTSFHSSASDVLVPVPPAYTDDILALAQWMFTRSIEGTFSDNKDDCRQAIVAEFGSTFDVTNIGKMVTNGSYWLPEYLFLSANNGESNSIRLWFSDPAFQAQYDLYEIVVVPPVVPLDDLHKSRSVVLQLLSEINIPDHLKKAAELKGPNPSTHLISTNYDWVDKNDPNITHPTPWTVIIWGGAGNNADIIREALVEYILANSQYGRDEWEKIYPDLFRPTEFYITPIWDRYSLPNQQTQAGLFSPTIPYRHMLSYARQTFHESPIDYVENNMTAVSTVFKGLMLLAVGNHRNRHNNFRFDELWPRYVDIGTQHTDFNRIPPKTQEFIRILITMLVDAEYMDEYTILRPGFSRVKRGDNWYLATTFDKVLYLVSIRSNVVIHPSVEGDTVVGLSGNLGILGTIVNVGSGDSTDGLYQIWLKANNESVWVRPLQINPSVDWRVTGPINVNIADGSKVQELYTGSISANGPGTITATYDNKVIVGHYRFDAV